MPITQQEIPVLDLLKKLGIVFDRYEHPPVLTVEEALLYDANHPGGHCKNLFLRDKNGKHHFLVILLSDTLVDLTKLAKYLKCGHLSFASKERLFKFLGIQPGAVGPFGLINDIHREVQVILDKSLVSTQIAGFHPNVNTATLVINVADLQKFLADLDYVINIVDFTQEIC